MPMNQQAKAVWERSFGATAQHGRDECGAMMAKGAHGTRGPHGWEIDHIVPRSRGGTNALDNLQPLHWENNDAKRNRTGGHWNCAKTK